MDRPLEPCRGAVDDATLALDLAPGLGPVTARRLVDGFGTAAAVLQATSGQLRDATGWSRSRSVACREGMRRGLDLVESERLLSEAKFQ